MRIVAIDSMRMPPILPSMSWCLLLVQRVSLDVIFRDQILENSSDPLKAAVTCAVHGTWAADCQGPHLKLS